MKDQFNRNIDYMRISITDRCNLRCKYCMPDGIECLDMRELLTYEEIAAVVTQAAMLGIKKIKVTGGEPLVRRGCVDLVAMLKEIPGIEQVTMTTNGVLLGSYLKQLQTAGLDAVNISLDTLNPKRFQEICGFDCHEKVLKSIEDAAKTDIRVKVNTVLQKGVNDDEWKQLLLLAKDQKVDVRFIEIMPIGQGKSDQGISNDTLLKQLREMYPDLEEDTSVHGNGPAVYVHIPGFEGSIGFISAMHNKFCANCNRIRMTSTGEIKPCLCFKSTVSVRDAVRANKTDEIYDILKDTIYSKPQAHVFEEKDTITEEAQMVSIGG